MNTQLDQVRNFMIAGGQSTRSEPISQLDRREALLRLDLIAEELDELREALNDPSTQYFQNLTVKVDKIAALDALTDILYVVFGTYHTLGLAHLAEAAFNEVQTSNMSKVDPATGLCIRDANTGKILKPANYVSPNLAKLFTTNNELSQ